MTESTSTTYPQSYKEDDLLADADWDREVDGEMCHIPTLKQNRETVWKLTGNSEILETTVVH